MAYNKFLFSNKYKEDNTNKSKNNEAGNSVKRRFKHISCCKKQNQVKTTIAKE